MQRGKRVALSLIVAAWMVALWFSGRAAGPVMVRKGTPPAGFRAGLTRALQAGPVVGTLVGATSALPDRLDPSRSIAAASPFGGAADALILGAAGRPAGVPAARTASCAALACIRPRG